MQVRPVFQDHAQRKSAPVLEWFDCSGDFQHGIAHGCQCVVLVGLREQFSFHQFRPISLGQEFHRLACDLMMRALFHYHPHVTTVSSMRVRSFHF